MNASQIRDGPNPHAEVLVVEDDEDEVWFIDRALRRNAMESRCEIVRSGEEAIRYLHQTVLPGSEHRPRPKVVVLDLKLGGISGREVLRQIRADASLCTIPVVVLSSSNSAEEVCECYRLGANSFVAKRRGERQPGDHVIDIARYWLELNQPVNLI